MTFIVKVQLITFMILAMTYILVQPIGIRTKPLWRDKDWKIKCTRRYTVGYCPNEAVTSVFMYSMSKQNCTERMGCPIATNTQNRFLLYEQCMITCQPITSLIVYHISNRSITQDTVKNLIDLTADTHSFIKEDTSQHSNVDVDENQSDEY